MKRSYLHSIYLRFVIIFVGILMISGVLSLGISTLVGMDEMKNAVREQLNERLTTMKQLVEDKGIPVEEAADYIEGAGVQVRFFPNREALVQDKWFSLPSNEDHHSGKGDILNGEWKGKINFPSVSSYVDDRYVVLIPQVNNNLITHFQNTVRTNILTTTILGTFFVLFAISLIVKRIRKISNASIQVAEGDLSVQIEDKGKDEIGELARNFNTMVKKLGENEYLHKEFVASVSHEFKTPVSSLKGFGKMLKSNHLSPERRNEYLDIIISESERLSQLSSNLLRLSELDHGVNTLRKNRFSLDEQIKEMLILFQDQWEQKNIHLHLHLEEIDYTGDEELLKQVWINLLSNSIKFSPDGGRLEINLQTVGNDILVSFSDHGIGIPEQHLKSIFNRFVKVDQSRSQYGTGLGLSIAKKVVELHAGEIWAESELGKGSTFNVKLKIEGNE
ncbi:hypothetical protein B4U37_01805 [Sutcliffiella horikoshii]|uniref:Heme sensor protein HssS n=1 Tax=Sutcliffiella horikoshii TaxID=79883 RepID=A0ABN4ZCS4_9BACI|nr:HAMP domain-containing sensor histidine kinase [Sutcliffiella horikoshii]ART74859.1 hypothetical protein B4U37_01805 [Sutcliffiella horikoshii]